MKKSLLLMLICSAAFCGASAQNSVSVDLTNKLLVNPDFECADTSSTEGVVKVAYTNGDTDHDKAIFSDAYGKIPYGWKASTSEFSGTSRGINADANYFHGHSLCWFTEGAFPVGYKLYQTIPADKLEPGLYKVSCLLAVEFARKGNSNEINTRKTGYAYTERLGAACLFANDNVQYYGMESDYGGNLTATDKEVTYANYALAEMGSGRANLRPLVVYVQINEGDTLQLGIRTSSIDKDGNQRGNRSGWFKVDNFKIEKVLAKPDMTPDEFTESVIVNNSFDLDPDGNETSSQLASSDYPDNLPYGWNLENASDSYGIHPNFLWDYEGTNAVFFNAEDVPLQNFCCYQIVPADNLEPGIYEVSCRLWQTYSEKFGQCRLYGTNGDSTYVQYYAAPSQYDQNIVDGENYTFANYPGWSDVYSRRDRQLHEMWVKVPVYPDQDLELGFKSGNVITDGTENAKAGMFHADYMRVYKQANLPVSYDGDADNDIETTSYKVCATIKRQYTNNVMSTICLPFALNADDITTIFGEGTKLAKFNTVTGGVADFTTATTIEAGVPYIICPTDVLPSPMIIDDVTITADAPQTTTSGNYSFVGTFNSETLTADDGSKLLIADDFKVEKPTADGNLPGFSAYLTASDGSEITAYTIDGTTTGIDSINAETQEDEPIYNLSGQRVNKDYRGAYVTKGKKIIRN